MEASNLPLPVVDTNVGGGNQGRRTISFIILAFIHENMQVVMVHKKQQLCFSCLRAIRRTTWIIRTKLCEFHRVIICAASDFMYSCCYVRLLGDLCPASQICATLCALCSF